MSNGVFNFNFLALLLSEILGGPKFTLMGPQDAPQRRNFLSKASTSQYLIVFLISTLQLQQFSSFQGVQSLRQGLCPPCTPPRGKIFVPEASTLLCLMAFSISTFQLLYFPRYQGGSQIYTRGPYDPGRPYRRIFLPKASTSQYLIVFLISTFQLQQFPRFQGGPKFTLGGPVPPVRFLADFFCTPGDYVTLSNGVFNFNFLALLLSYILGGSQIYTRGPYAPWTPQAEKFLYPKRVLYNISLCF